MSLPRDAGRYFLRKLALSPAQVPAAATTTTIGGVLKTPTQAASTAVDVPGLVTDFNALLTKLKNAGIVS